MFDDSEVLRAPSPNFVIDEQCEAEIADDSDDVGIEDNEESL